MLKIRLQRTGRVHETSFRVVVTDSQNSTKSGRVLEVVGSYDPRKTDEKMDADRIKYWLSQGAQASGTVHNMLINQKIITGKKVNVLPKKHPPVKEAPKTEGTATPTPEAKPAEAPTAEAPKA